MNWTTGALLSLLAFSIQAAPFPMTGTSIPSLAPIDALVTNLMAQYQVPGGAIGFVRNGKLLFVRGYGYADTNTQELVKPDSLFRLASLSKSITAAATLKLSEQGALILDRAAFPLLNYPPPTYPGAAVDPRLNSITVRQLLNHAGGWNRDTAPNPDGGTGFDPTVNWTVRAAADMGTAAPADAATIVRWMMGKPLQADPGTQYSYSNFGYTVLGRIIEKLTGSSYEHFAQSLLAQAGITRMRIGGSRLADKLPGEVTYYDYTGSGLTTSIFPQDQTPVPWPYNFSYATMDSHGGWVASVIDMLRFVTAVDGRASHSNILSSASISNMIARPSPPWGPNAEPYYGMGWLVRPTPDNWWHDGSLPGVRSEVVRAGNGFTWVILFNTRVEQDGQFFSQMDNLGWQALNAVSNWPTNDLFPVTLSYPAWRTRHFTASELNDASLSGDGADRDGDGLVNLAEYALGLDPKIADRTRPSAGNIQTVDGQRYLTLSFRRLLLAYEVNYLVEVSGDFVNWEPAATQVGEPVLNSDGTQSVTYRDSVPIDSARRFMRLRVARAPLP